MIEDMTLAGLAVGTQKIYIQSVRRKRCGDSTLFPVPVA
jgi:hypothetical protein